MWLNWQTTRWSSAGPIPTAGRRLRAATATPADAQVLRRLRDEAVAVIDRTTAGQAEQLLVPARYWDLVLP
ncbi:hypothetical protein [Kitasatospora sp. McL0602]|uniref:hypothetical protein n=1 Tax=Kitasatospora sp. McL0602 TaxID=3439530 RepID=UPI003F8A93FC